MVEKVEASSVWSSSFTMILKGVIDAAVNGGIKLYKQAFFAPSVLNTFDPNKIQTLREAVNQQISILTHGMEIHRKLRPQNLKALHEQLESNFCQQNFFFLNFSSQFFFSTFLLTIFSSQFFFPLSELLQTMKKSNENLFKEDDVRRRIFLLLTFLTLYLIFIFFFFLFGSTDSLIYLLWSTTRSLAKNQLGLNFSSSMKIHDKERKRSRMC